MKTLNESEAAVDRDIDDLDTMHPIDCVCDECVDNLVITMQEDRAA